MTEFESEAELREHEATTDDGGDVAENPDQDEHGRDADEVTRPAGPAPDERTTAERPAP